MRLQAICQSASHTAAKATTAFTDPHRDDRSACYEGNAHAMLIPSRSCARVGGVIAVGERWCSARGDAVATIRFTHVGVQASGSVGVLRVEARRAGKGVGVASY